MSRRRLLQRSWWAHLRRDYLNPRSPISWTVLLSLLLSATFAWALWQTIEHRDDVINAQQQFNARICVALPDTAAAAAAALVDVVVADDIRNGEPPAEIARTRALGRAYIERARERALDRLPECRPPVATPPIEGDTP